MCMCVRVCEPVQHILLSIGHSIYLAEELIEAILHHLYWLLTVPQILGAVLELFLQARPSLR